MSFFCVCHRTWQDLKPQQNPNSNNVKLIITVFHIAEIMSSEQIYLLHKAYQCLLYSLSVVVSQSLLFLFQSL